MPIDPATLLGIGGQLLGGILGRKKEKAISAGDNAYSHVEGIMRAAKKFGWSPLALMGSVGAVGGTPGYTDNSAFGNAVSNAAMLAADNIQRNASTAQRLNQYQTQNQRLTEKLNAMTIRPPVPGLYGAAALPADPEVYGGQAATVSDQVLPRVQPTGPAGRPLFDVDTGLGGDPRRAVDNQDVKSHPGYILIDNPNLPVPVRVPTLDGDEALQWYNYPSLFLPSLWAGADFVRSPAFGPAPGYASDGAPLATRNKFPELSNAWRGATIKRKPKTKSKRKDMFGTLGFQ